MSGLWIVRFSGPMGGGAGVVYFTDREVFGGDTGFKYIGSYESNGSSIVANLRITQHTPGTISVFGSTQSFDLKITGTVTGNTMNGQGVASHAPGQAFKVNLERAV